MIRFCFILFACCFAFTARAQVEWIPLDELSDRMEGNPKPVFVITIRYYYYDATLLALLANQWRCAPRTPHEILSDCWTTKMFWTLKNCLHAKAILYVPATTYVLSTYRNLFYRSAAKTGVLRIAKFLPSGI